MVGKELTCLFGLGSNGLGAIDSQQSDDSQIDDIKSHSLPNGNQ